MISSSQFFRKTLFTPDEQLPPPASLPALHDALAPWAAHQDSLYRLPEPKRRLQRSPRPLAAQKGNCQLLPARSISQSQVHPPRSLIPSLPSVLLKSRQALEVRKKASPPHYPSMSIRQFLSQQHRELSLEQALHERSLAILSEELHGSFLVKRNQRKKLKLGEQSKTIDVNRRRESNPEVLQWWERNDYAGMQKYKPLRNNRYHF